MPYVGYMKGSKYISTIFHVHSFCRNTKRILFLHTVPLKWVVVSTDMIRIRRKKNSAWFFTKVTSLMFALHWNAEKLYFDLEGSKSDLSYTCGKLKCRSYHFSMFVSMVPYIGISLSESDLAFLFHVSYQSIYIYYHQEYAIHLILRVLTNPEQRVLVWHFILLYQSWNPLSTIAYPWIAFHSSVSNKEWCCVHVIRGLSQATNKEQDSTTAIGRNFVW